MSMVYGNQKLEWSSSLTGRLCVHNSGILTVLNNAGGGKKKINDVPYISIM